MFEKLGFSYDLYSKTTDCSHISFVTNFHKKLYESDYIYEKTAPQAFCEHCQKVLRDRAITRNLDWGIDVPKKGNEDKKIYIWAENLLGYLSVSNVVAESRGVNFKELWGSNLRHYYVHGKDNIPFHTIILPALLLAHSENLHLPDDIISREYLTLEGKFQQVRTGQYGLRI